MTCKTCNGRGVYEAYVSTFQFHPPQPDHQPLSMHDGGVQIVVCHDCDTRFARPEGQIYGRLRVAGVLVSGVGQATVDDMVGRINAVVETREAAYRASIQSAREAIGEISGKTTFPEIFDRCVKAHQILRDAIRGEAEAVTGDVACGLAFDLGAAQGTLHAVQNYYGPLLDVLNASGGQASVMAVGLGRALGLFDHRERFLAGINDEELRAECRRRGWHPEMGLAPRYDLPLTVPAGVDFAGLEPGEAVLVQHEPRRFVRIRNIDTSPTQGIVDEFADMTGMPPDFTNIDEQIARLRAMRTRVAEVAPPPALVLPRPYRETGPIQPCANTRCSRFGSHHDGIPCDTRRARR